MRQLCPGGFTTHAETEDFSKVLKLFEFQSEFLLLDFPISCKISVYCRKTTVFPEVYDLIASILTPFFMNGTLKAEGRNEHEMLEGGWKFYRETKQLWQIGKFKNNKKHGSWIWYNRDDRIEYQETFSDGKIVK